MVRKTRALGNWGEEYAVHYLRRSGHVIVERNFSVRDGEIDIIAYDRSTHSFVFIEVKVRTTKTFGLPEESIGSEKKLRLNRAVESYISLKTYSGHYRFDVILIVVAGIRPTIRHLKGVSLE